MVSNNSPYTVDGDEIGPYDHGRDVVHVIQNECNCVGLPLFLLDLLRVGSNLDPLHLHRVVHDTAPLNDRIPVGSLCLVVVVRRGDPLYRHRDDS